MKLTVAHVVLLLLLIGAGQLVAGIYILAGIGWAVIAMGLATVFFGAVVARGMNANG
jgi:hypothetical protein